MADPILRSAEEEVFSAPNRELTDEERGEILSANHRDIVGVETIWNHKSLAELRSAVFTITTKEFRRTP
jgi:hypothetical protein